ncbi:MAG TPA: TIGR03619 family F420-dependent LLM class oxidoreductase [Acidimicrobiales bacterium]|nr:TIGR03619 family F420-dependent LLM class oxidoreductase [Acidimicrobiales bacterium]
MRIGVTAILTDRTMAPHDFARAAEERGYESMYLPEHTHMPVEAVPPALVSGVGLEDYRRSVDPFVALAAATAVTERILLGTGVALVAQHDAIALAKQVATLDHLSGGRIVLGVGFGWNRAEAADHGVDFTERRAVVREKVLAMQALWSQDVAEFRGEHVSLSPSYAWPKPVQQPRVRVLLGGAAGPRLFAAIAEYADGWMPIGGAGVAGARDELRRVVAAAGRDPERIEVVPFGTVPDDGKLDHYASIGCSEVVLRVPSGEQRDMLRTLDDYARFVGKR